MQLRHLKTFVAVASTLNITRAAQAIHLAQSSVTEQIQALEADLGVPLFDRSQRRLRLTEAGRRLLAQAGELLARVESVRDEVTGAAGRLGGTLRIGALETLCSTRLPPLLAAFRRDHPDVALNLRAEGSAGLRDGLRRGELDVCFGFGAAPADPDLQSEAVADEVLVVVAPPGSADGAPDPFLVTQEGCVYRRMFEAAFPPDADERPPIAGEFGSIGAILALVRDGAGCALVPAVAAEAFDADLARRPWHGAADRVATTMRWRRHDRSPALLRFLDAARGHFAAFTPADARPPRAAPCR